MEDLRTFPLDLVTKDLFYRNYGLAGKLKISHFKKFKENEKSKAGVSKKSWRLIKLVGDAEFTESIYNFRDNHKFQLGSSYVQIRGGNRRPATMAEKSRDDMESSRRRMRRLDREEKEKAEESAQ
jgi:hypothetical protein